MAITTPSTRERDRTPVAERRHPAADSGPLSRTVYAALASAEGVEPTDLDFELYRSVDVDALDALFRHSSPSSASPPSYGERWSFSFDVAGYEITVESSGRVAVYDVA